MLTCNSTQTHARSVEFHLHRTDSTETGSIYYYDCCYSWCKSDAAGDGEDQHGAGAGAGGSMEDGSCGSGGCSFGLASAALVWLALQMLQLNLRTWLRLMQSFKTIVAINSMLLVVILHQQLGTVNSFNIIRASMHYLIHPHEPCDSFSEGRAAEFKARCQRLWIADFDRPWRKARCTEPKLPGIPCSGALAP